MTYLHPEVIVMSVIHTHTMHRVIVAYCWSLNNTVTESLIKENKETAVRWIERTEIAEPLGLKRESFVLGVIYIFSKHLIFFNEIKCWMQKYTIIPCYFTYITLGLFHEVS